MACRMKRRLTGGSRSTAASPASRSARSGKRSFANSRLVERLGTRLISQAAVLALIALSVGHIAVILLGVESLVSYMLFQALSMTCIGLCGSNFGAMAMEPVGEVHADPSRN